MNSRCRDLLIELGTIVPVSRRDLTERIDALLREDVATDGDCCGRREGCSGDVGESGVAAELVGVSEGVYGPGYIMVNSGNTGGCYIVFVGNERDERWAPGNQVRFIEDKSGDFQALECPPAVDVLRGGESP